MSKKVIVVTGSCNTGGIGFFIAKNLLSNPKYRVVLTYRKEEDFKKAKAALLKNKVKEEQFFGTKLDITKSDSIVEFIKFVKKNVPEGVNILVNNAGVMMTDKKFESCKFINEVNIIGTMNFTHKMLHNCLVDDFKIINISSQLSACASMDKELKKKFLNVDSPEGIVTLLNDFFKVLKEDGLESKSYESKYGKWYGYQYYSTSKLAMNGYTRYMAFKDKTVKKKKGLVCCCCPGWCKTKLGGNSAPKTAEQGSETPLWLIKNAEGDKFNGLFFSEKKQVEM